MSQEMRQEEAVLYAMLRPWQRLFWIQDSLDMERGSGQQRETARLSLPIPKSKRVKQSSEPKPNKKRSASSQMTVQSPSRRDSQHFPSQTFDALGDAGITRYSFVSMDPTSTTTSPMLPPPNLVWPPTASHARDGTSTRHNKRVRRHSLRPLQVPAYQTVRGLEGLPMSIGSGGKVEASLVPID